MAHRRIADMEAEPVVPRRLARAPIIDGQIIGNPRVDQTESLRDDLGRHLNGTVHADGRVELAEPTDRRLFFTGWVH